MSVIVSRLRGSCICSFLLSCFHLACRQVFDVTKIDAAALAAAMGLPMAPKIKIKGTGAKAKSVKNLSYQVRNLLKEESDEKKAAKTDGGFCFAFFVSFCFSSLVLFPVFPASVSPPHPRNSVCCGKDSSVCVKRSCQSKLSNKAVKGARCQRA